jgi:hypothetical protein
MCDLIYDLMMRLNELIDTIIDTDYEDWTYDDEHGIRVLKADLSIFIQERRGSGTRWSKPITSPRWMEGGQIYRTLEPRMT